jgi:hypothetical protein
MRYGWECHVGANTFGILAKRLVNILVVRIWDFINLGIRQAMGRFGGEASSSELSH